MYEYKIIDERSEPFKTVTDRLNQLSIEGWELVTADKPRLFLRRIKFIEEKKCNIGKRTRLTRVITGIARCFQKK